MKSEISAWHHRSQIQIKEKEVIGCWTLSYACALCWLRGSRNYLKPTYRCFYQQFYPQKTCHSNKQNLLYRIFFLKLMFINSNMTNISTLTLRISPFTSAPLAVVGALERSTRNRKWKVLRSRSLKLPLLLALPWVVPLCTPPVAHSFKNKHT